MYKRQGKNGGPAGDLLIVVSVRPHEIFRREGTSVLCEAPITFTQAVLGAELEIPTIDGKVKYTIPEGTQSGTTFRLKGKGIPGLNVDPGNASENEIALAVSRYQLFVAGNEYWLIDQLNTILRVGGVDYAKDIRSVL